MPDVRTIGPRTTGQLQRRLFTFGAAFLFLAILALLIILMLASFGIGEGADPLISFGARVRLLQITIGMIVGLVLTALGIFLTWLGVAGESNVEVSTPLGGGKAITALPGSMMVVCGTVLISICIVKNVELNTRVVGGKDLEDTLRELRTASMEARTIFSGMQMEVKAMSRPSEP